MTKYLINIFWQINVEDLWQGNVIIMSIVKNVRGIILFFCQIDFNFGPVELNLVSNGNAFVKLVSLTLKSDKNLKSSETTQLSGSILFSHMDLHMSNTLKSHHIYKPVIINITTSQKIRHI